MKLGLMAVDPGGTTGLAWGIFDTDGDGIADMLASGVSVGSAEATGSEQWQAARIVDHWLEFRDLCSGLSYPCELVIEDFVLRPGRATADRAQLAPVRVTSLIEGMLCNHDLGKDTGHGEETWNYLREWIVTKIVIQQVSAAKSFATKDRMQRWGIWQVGMRHSRDAWRHIALRLATQEMLKNRGRNADT